MGKKRKQMNNEEADSNTLKLVLEYRRFERRLKTVKSIFRYGTQCATAMTMCICATIIIVKGEIEWLKGLNELVDTLGAERVFYILYGVGSTAIWKLERRGKKRLLEEKAKLQQELEKNDPKRTSSGLTKHGDTPILNEDI